MPWSRFFKNGKRINHKMVDAQQQLAEDQHLPDKLIDISIAIALKLDITPHEVLNVTRDNIAFTEEAWEQDYRPRLIMELALRGVRV